MNAQQRTIVRMAAIGLIISFLFFAISILFPPDMNSNPPIYQKPALMLQLASTALVIFGSTLLGIQLIEEKKTVPAAGFTMLSIATALSIVIFFEFRHFSTEEYEKIYEIYSGYVALLIPTCLLLMYHKDAPVWVRSLMALYTVNQTWVMAMYYLGNRNYSLMDEISFAGYMLYEVYLFALGISFLRKSVHFHSPDYSEE